MSKHSKSHATKGRNPSETSAGIDREQDMLDTNQSPRASNIVDAVSDVDEEGHGLRASGEAEELERATAGIRSKRADEGSLFSKAASALDSQAMRKNLNLVRSKAQDFISSGREQISTKYAELSDDVKLRGMMVDDKIKANPYAYALGAAGLGFILGRAISGKGKQDLDVLVSTVNKLNLSALAGYLGMRVDEGPSGEVLTKEEMGKAGYNESQARHIG